MNLYKRALLLVGSPKAGRSTSASIGNYLLTLLHKKGLQTESLHIDLLLGSQEGRNKLLLFVDNSEILILSCPLYVDTLPSSVTRVMELIAEHRKNSEGLKKQQLLAILNCGLPEAQHNDVALSVCRQFTVESSLDWVGGLSLGMGEAIGGQPIEKMSCIIRNVKKSLELTANALAEGKLVPNDAVELMAKPLMPMWSYVWFIAIICKLKAIKNRIYG